MKREYLLLLSTLLIGCGSELPRISADPNLEYNQAEEFKPYFKSFENEFSLSTRFIQAEFTNELRPGVTGQCYINKAPPKGNVIKVSKERWTKLSEEQRLMVIYHELGHCLLLRFHTNIGNYEDGCPRTLMLGQVMSNKCFTDHKEDLSKEFLQGINKEDAAVMIYLGDK